MNLRCLHCDIPMLLDRILCRKKALECMTTLVRNDIKVTACAVKVCKDKRCIVIRKECHITARPFCFAAQYIKQFILHHEIYEFRSFRR